MKTKEKIRQKKYIGGHSKSKVSTVDLKALFPHYTNHPYCELEYRAKDDLHEEYGSLTVWAGENYSHCESIWESVVISLGRQLQFVVPGVPYKFVLVNGTIYYRKNGE